MPCVTAAALAHRRGSGRSIAPKTALSSKRRRYPSGSSKKVRIKELEAENADFRRCLDLGPMDLATWDAVTLSDERDALAGRVLVACLYSRARALRRLQFDTAGLSRAQVETLADHVFTPAVLAQSAAFAAEAGFDRKQVVAKMVGAALYGPGDQSVRACELLLKAGELRMPPQKQVALPTLWTLLNGVDEATTATDAQRNGSLDAFADEEDDDDEDGERAATVPTPGIAPPTPEPGEPGSELDEALALLLRRT